ncbi:N-methylhydantoinase A [Rhodopseudomonas julia]|uniref:N-methylhydantoinase A n=1 Tax=Rhodopseudomonas julia TaxID=200617 RepID=A0ABU0CAM0_9BRAD|nr:hydantoinase/oxoprolinase family protein [Rhodopseudomonas julia]MDQ0327581.1 N-methylhydantoinase A [Rhodopseudomonas julia]
MSYRVGVDIGGTFIDFCFFNEQTDDIFTLKVLTTPSKPGSEVMEGLKIAQSRHGIEPSEITSFVHGTTVGVNTLIQGVGARLALFATENFEDVLELARLRMPETYNLQSSRPDPLVAKDLVFSIRERMRSDGKVLRALDRDSVVEAVARAREKGAEGIIVALINAYRNADHEREVVRIVREVAPELFVFASTDIWPVIREYERTTTAVINGYVHPRVAHYISSLQAALREHAVQPEPLVTKSNGGIMNAELGKENCVSMLLSGTASGVMGGAFVASRAGCSDALTIDIGGTSADVAVIIDGKPQFAAGEKVGPHSLYVPAVAVSSIGEGGGSVAWVDDFGVLKVGPESAGSDPGPACYGRGGTKPTITDAFAVCGLIGHDSLAYGSISIDVDKARAAVGTIAEKLGWSLKATAQAIINVAISGMYLEINKLIARHGIDVRSFTLVAFGGAGPMLAPMLALELGIRQVLVPTTPGVVSALGGLVSDIRNDFISSHYLTVASNNMEAIRAGFEELKREALLWLREEQKFKGEPTFLLSADMNYAGQSFEIETDLEADWLEGEEVTAIIDAFHARHVQLYDFHDADAEVNIVNLRLVVTAAGPRPELKSVPVVRAPAEPARYVPATFADKTVQAGLYLRHDLAPGHFFEGPAIVLQSDSTTCIPEGFSASVDGFGNIMLQATAEKTLI